MADVELVAPHDDGDYYHAAEFRNMWQAHQGGGVLTHTITASLTGADRVITVPAFNARVPNGSGALVSVAYAGGTVTAGAGDASDPRQDALVIDSAGTLALTAGTPTTLTGNVVDPPVPPLASDEILLGVVYVAAMATTIANTNVKGRAINVSTTGKPVPNISVYTTAGADSFDATQVTDSPDGKPYAEVIVIGGGGGGGNISTGAGAATGGGGGGGGYASEVIDLTGETSITVTVGAGGAGGAGGGGNNGSAGGTTSFGSFLQATGGAGGTQSGGTFAAGGVGSGGDVNSEGGDGGPSGTAIAFGGDSQMGRGAPASFGENLAGEDGKSYGGGGAGGHGNGGGGDGADGIVIVRW